MVGERKKFLRGLNPEQKQAITHKNGPLLIVAGAGTGKTRVITDRIVYLISSKLAKPSEILALTFTEKATNEMLERVDTAMPLGYEEIWISTFHSFCDRILREEGLAIGLNTAYRILSKIEQWHFIRKNFFQFNLKYYRPLSNPTQFIHALLNLFNRAKDNDVIPEEFLTYSRGLETNSPDEEETGRIKELASAYQTYQDLLLKENRLDFGDLQSFVLRLLRTRKNIRRKYQEKFKYILVDEFQDTNYAQNELLKLLINAKKNITVCGDDDQSIYKFRGASIVNINQFTKIYPGRKRVVLIKNYRSPQVLLNSAYRLIKNNNPERLEVKEKIDKKLISASTQGNKDTVGFKRFESPENEAEWISDKILSLHKQGVFYQDIAVLARNNAYLNPFITSFRLHDIPYRFVGNRGLYDQEEIRDLIAYLKCLTDPQDDIAFFALLSLPLFKIEMESLLLLLNFARRYNEHLYSVVKKITYLKENLPIAPETIKKIERITNFLEAKINAIKKESASQILKDFLEKSGYLKELLTVETIENVRKVQNINLFFKKILQFEATNPDKSVLAFGEYLDLMQEAGDNPAQAEIEDIEVVNLSTVHSAKGLEFSFVFMVDLAEGRFPFYFRKEEIPLPDSLIKEEISPEDMHIQEERRLFYVGMTRAKKRLWFTASSSYTMAKNWRISRFVKESLGKVSAEIQTELPLGTFSLSAGEKKKYFFDLPITLKNFSYTQFKDYQRCPFFYKLKHIIGVPELPNSSYSFGQTVHLTLKEFYSLIRSKESVNAERLLSFYEKNWINEGYMSKEQESEQKIKGMAVLKDFYRINSSNFGEPVYLEQFFKVNLGKELFLRGRIDRIDKLPDKKYEVIDYKSGNPPTRKNIDREEQLTIYALACQDVLGFFPKILSFYYLGTNEKFSTERKFTDLEMIKGKLLSVISQIRRKEFPPIGSQRDCKKCSYRLICPKSIA
ncbi:ATP-dependent DNA helicase Rep [subsurface metagenome]